MRSPPENAYRRMYASCNERVLWAWHGHGFVALLSPLSRGDLCTQSKWIHMNDTWWTFFHVWDQYMGCTKGWKFITRQVSWSEDGDHASSEWHFLDEGAVFAWSTKFGDIQLVPSWEDHFPFGNGFGESHDDVAELCKKVGISWKVLLTMRWILSCWLSPSNFLVINNQVGGFILLLVWWLYACIPCFCYHGQYVYRLGFVAGCCTRL